jgi:hypothetical protein
MFQQLHARVPVRSLTTAAWSAPTRPCEATGPTLGEIGRRVIVQLGETASPAASWLFSWRSLRALR